jgi:hypothetical protein
MHKNSTKKALFIQFKKQKKKMADKLIAIEKI